MAAIEDPRSAAAETGSVVERAALRIPLLVALVLAAGAALVFRQPIVNAVRDGAARCRRPRHVAGKKEEEGEEGE